MTVIDQLTAARPDRLNPPPAQHAEAIAAIVATQTTKAAGPRTRRAVLTTAAAAAVAAVVGVAVAPDGAKKDDEPESPAEAHALLLAAADRSANTQATTGRYLNLQTEYGTALTTGRYTMVQRTLGQYWLASNAKERSWVTTQSLGAKPATPADEAAYQRAGSPEVVEAISPKPGARKVELSTKPGKLEGNPVDPGKIFGIGKQSLTMADLDKLPTDPAALRADLLARFDGGGGDAPTDRGQWLLDVTSSLLVNMPVSNAVRAAAFRMLADLPEVRALGAVPDVRGRTGQAVAFIQDTPLIGSFEVRLIIDPGSGQTLAQERRAVRPQGPWSWVAPGALMNYAVMVAATYTDDSPPRLPAQEN